MGVYSVCLWGQFAPAESAATDESKGKEPEEISKQWGTCAEQQAVECVILNWRSDTDLQEMSLASFPLTRLGNARRVVH